MNIILSGVGGQGVLRSAEILSKTAIMEGQRVIASETHGMAQRGGSVVTHVRIGSDIHGPLIPKGEADIIVGFEPAEALRVMNYSNSKTKVIVNEKRITPVPVLSGLAEYPPNKRIFEEIKKFSPHILVVNATSLAEKAGSVKCMNVLMLGILVGMNAIPFSPEVMKKVIRETFPRFAKPNLNAFNLGISVGKDSGP